MLAGSAVLRWTGAPLTVQKGESVFLPAGLGAYTLEGAAELILSKV